MSYPKLAVMADPKDAGRHPFHDNRWIVTEGMDIEWSIDETEWRVRDGALIAMMRDCQHQRELARLFASAPELLEALEACVTSDGAACFSDMKSNPQRMQSRLHAISDIARAAIAKARGL